MPKLLESKKEDFFLKILFLRLRSSWVFMLEVTFNAILLSIDVFLSAMFLAKLIKWIIKLALLVRSLD